MEQKRGNHETDDKLCLRIKICS